MTGCGPSIEGEIQRLLAEDDQITELGVEVLRDGDGVVLRGQVTTAGRRDRIAARVREAYPDTPVRCDIAVAGVAAPDAPERLEP